MSVDGSCCNVVVGEGAHENSIGGFGLVGGDHVACLIDLEGGKVRYR